MWNEFDTRPRPILQLLYKDSIHPLVARSFTGRVWARKMTTPETPIGLIPIRFVKLNKKALNKKKYDFRKT